MTPAENMDGFSCRCWSRCKLDDDHRESEENGDDNDDNNDDENRTSKHDDGEVI